ncbi:hypothetical protein [Sphingobacterium deserti]|uniref:SH3b domain-containing protein n=1 Tax=Sphingobacterium deserti TaxID=1229276 RepID=A0A0B8SZS1_9SPHI|nr:hypothetical protein [Sphingobacterium deserti]KGE13477.1 hypothetical protein DI53_2762 [Sphingobacterium deserti]
MRYCIIHLFLLLLPYLAYCQERPTAYTLSDEYNLWGLSVSDTTYIFAENAYVRDQPNLDGTVLDSLPAGSMLIILSPAYNGNKIKGVYAPWHQVAYKIGNDIKKGFIWIGLLSLGKQQDAQGNVYLYGFDRFIPSDGNKADRYICSVKLLNAKNALIGKHQFEMPYAGQSYMDAKLLPNMGLKDLRHIFRIAFSGEACGIPTDYYYAGWNGSNFFALPKRYAVSDAGIFYYEESILFPTEHRKEANVIYKLIEHGEAVETTDALAEITYKVSRTEEKFLWTGKGFTKLGDSK